MLGIYAILLTSCGTQSPDQWAQQYRDLVVYSITIEDGIGDYSPINVGLSIETENGGVNRRDSLSTRVRKRMYRSLEEALQPFIEVQAPLEERQHLLARYPGWPDYTFAVAQSLRSASLYAALSGQLKARQMDVTVKGITVQRSVPVLRLHLEVLDGEGARIYQRQTKIAGDPSLGGSLEIGNWSLDNRMVVREKEVLDLFRQALQRILQP